MINIDHLEAIPEKDFFSSSYRNFLGSIFVVSHDSTAMGGIREFVDWIQYLEREMVKKNQEEIWKRRISERIYF